jgi:hypothetical protein
VRGHKSTILCAVLLSACAANPSADIASCEFVYNEPLQQSVFGLIKAKFPNAFEFFNYRTPTVTRRDGRVELLILPTNEVRGLDIIYDRTFVVAVDPCINKILESFEAE